MPAPGVTCSNPITLGGSASGPRDGGTGTDAAPEAGGCGAVDSLLGTMSGCLPCAGASLECCAADQACTGTCELLLQCTLACAGDQTCVEMCKTNWQAGVRAYEMLAQCLTANCGTQCAGVLQ